jgi:cystathionine beta-lyase family protein involved in aluminum resistance
MAIKDYLTEHFNIDSKYIELAAKAEADLVDVFSRFDNTKKYNQYKVFKAMQDQKLSDTHFIGSTGYGYGDSGRDTIDSIFAQVFGCEDALVRTNIVSGTHAISLALFGVLRPGDELLCITGKPYDTLEEVIGIRQSGNYGSLSEFGIGYRQLDLTHKSSGNYEINIDSIFDNINDKTKMCLIQRSRGYEWRESFSNDKIGKAVSAVKEINSDIVILVDNCYGEFTDMVEPTEVGADLIAGSLIKNPGGGIALAGGYVAGKKNYIQQIACRLTSPGIGKEVGATLGQNRSILQGFYFAPHVVCESLKGAAFCARMMELLGIETMPSSMSIRNDIVQAIKFNDEKKLIAFCKGIQKSSVVDSFVVPYPWNMPGYSDPVIMAAGTFVQGASIELSADAPIREPYIAYVQGGLVYESVKLGVLSAIQIMKEEHLL